MHLFRNEILQINNTFLKIVQSFPKLKILSFSSSDIPFNSPETRFHLLFRFIYFFANVKKKKKISHENDEMVRPKGIKKKT